MRRSKRPYNFRNDFDLYLLPQVVDFSDHRRSEAFAGDIMSLAVHQHGKGRVRLGRVWREGNVHYMVEWTVSVMLESDMAHAFIDGSNADMTATDTQKNTVC